MILWRKPLCQLSKCSGAGKKLTEAGRLKLRPLCVYGTDKIPEGAVPSYKVDRCIAKAVYTSALFEDTPPLYIEAAHEQCCAGGMVWTGLAEPNPMLKYFVTVGTPEFRGGAAEHLKASPELFEESMKRAGKITPPGKYIVIGPCTDDISPETIRSLILFAGSEQIRNLCGLAQFSSSDLFFKTVIPGGPTCATMLTFPAGMAENAPKDSAYVGPTDPTGNHLAASGPDDHGHPCRTGTADGSRPGRVFYLQAEQDSIS